MMASMMGPFQDGGAHSYFCILDFLTGERLNCPLSSTAHAFCSAIVDSTSAPGTETVWVFCSAWDRANKTSCATPGWGCGACADPAGGCYVASFSCSAPDLRDCGDSWNFTKALPLPGKVTVPNVGVALVPRHAPPANSTLPRHQAFMALETSFSVAVNVGTDGDLSANWLLLDPQVYGVEGVSDSGLCPFARYNAEDGFYYVAGGGHHVNLARSPSLQRGSWANPPASPAIAVGCTDQAEDCSPGSPVARLSGFYSHYWANNSDHGGREYLQNLTAWDWSVNDADACDNGTHTFFIYGQCAQTAPRNWTGRAGYFYRECAALACLRTCSYTHSPSRTLTTHCAELGIAPGTTEQWMASYYP
jgi:hypothetical protein